MKKEYLLFIAFLFIALVCNQSKSQLDLWLLNGSDLSMVDDSWSLKIGPYTSSLAYPKLKVASDNQFTLNLQSSSSWCTMIMENSSGHMQMDYRNIGGGQYNIMFFPGAIQAFRLTKDGDLTISGSIGSSGVNTSFINTGYMKVEGGVIKKGNENVNTQDLGLYSQSQGYWLRIVSNSAPIRFFTNGSVTNEWRGEDNNAAMTIDPNGSVGIGSQYPDAAYKLNVLGKIRATEIRVQTGWADFVFKPEYKIKSLAEVENYISENGHLPDIPSEQEVSENGVELGDISAKLLQKIEELTVYVIEQKKEIEKLKEENKKLDENFSKLK